MRKFARADKISTRGKHLPYFEAQVQPHLGALSGGSEITNALSGI